MCGIFGVRVGDDSFPARKLLNLFDDLFLFSESRGKEASGLAIADRHRIQVLKSAVAASAMIRSPQYRQLMIKAVHGSPQQPITMIGHSRLVTDDSRYDQKNNQ